MQTVGTRQPVSIPGDLLLQPLSQPRGWGCLGWFDWMCVFVDTGAAWPVLGIPQVQGSLLRGSAALGSCCSGLYPQPQLTSMLAAPWLWGWGAAEVRAGWGAEPGCCLGTFQVPLGLGCSMGHLLWG